MTPEDIVNKIINSSKQDFGRAHGIEAIQQYAKDFAKQMCDKQRNNCEVALRKADPSYAKESEAVLNAPYPKELI